MSDDLISRQDAIDLIHKTVYGFFDIIDDESEEPISEKDKLLLEVNKAVSNGIKDLPSAQSERKNGKWIGIKIGNGDTRYTCSECGASYECDSRDRWDFFFCPDCGAKME